MIRLLLTAAAGVIALAASGCSSTDEGTAVVAPNPILSTAAPTPVPELRGTDPSLVAQVDCGDDGVANVNVQYGVTNRDTLVGRNPTTLQAGGSASFSSNYGLGRGDANVLFTIMTSPTRGTCKTTLTDYNSGEVIAEKETAGRVTLKVILTGSA